MSVGNFMKCNVYFCTLVLRKIFVFILAFFLYGSMVTLA